MIVTIWRHGEAEQGPVDRERCLTDRGCDDVGFGCEQLHEALASRGLAAPDRILYSPWVRTRETAGIIASAYTHAESAPEEALRPGSNVAAVAQRLESVLQRPAVPGHLVLVSHQPLVSRLLAYFLGDGDAVPPLSPGAYATFTLEVSGRDCGSLRFWAMPPEYEAGV